MTGVGQSFDEPNPNEEFFAGTDSIKIKPGVSATTISQVNAVANPQSVVTNIGNVDIPNQYELPKGMADAATSQFGNEQITLGGTVEIKLGFNGQIFEDIGSSLKFDDSDSLIGGKITLHQPPVPYSTVSNTEVLGEYIITEIVKSRTTGSGPQNIIIAAKEGQAVAPQFTQSATLGAVISPKNSFSLCSNIFTDVFDFVASKDALLNPILGIGGALLQTGSSAVAGAIGIVDGIGAQAKGIFDQSSNTGGQLLGQVGALSGEIVGTVEGILAEGAGTVAGKAEAAFQEGRDAIVKGLDTVTGLVQGFSANNPFDMQSIKDFMDDLIPDVSFDDIEFPDLCPKKGAAPVAGAKFGQGDKMDPSFQSGTGALFGGVGGSVFGSAASGFLPPVDRQLGAGGCGSSAAPNQFSKLSRDDDVAIKEARQISFNDSSEDKRVHYTTVYKSLTLRLDENEMDKEKHWQIWVYDPATKTVSSNRALGIQNWKSAGGGAA